MRESLARNSKKPFGPVDTYVVRLSPPPCKIESVVNTTADHQWTAPPLGVRARSSLSLWQHASTDWSGSASGHPDICGFVRSAILEIYDCMGLKSSLLAYFA